MALVPPSDAEVTRASAIIDDIIIWLQQLIVYFNQYLAQLLANITNILGGIITTIANWLNQALAQIVTWFQQIVTSLNTFLSGLLVQLRDFFINLWNSVVNATVAAITRIANFVTSITLTIEAFIRHAIDLVTDWVRDLAVAVADYLTDLIGAVLDVAQAAKDAIINFVTDVVDAVVDYVASVIAQITDAFESILGAVDSALAALVGRIETIQDAIGDAIDEVVSSLKSLSTEQLKPLKESVVKTFDVLRAIVDPAELAALTQAADTITAPNTLALLSRADAQAFFRALLPRSPLAKWLFLTTFSLSIGLKVYSGIGEANAQMVLREYGRAVAWQILSPADAATAARKQLISSQAAFDVIRQHGYSEQDAGVIMRLGEIQPAIGEMLSMLNRGLVQEAAVDDALREMLMPAIWRGPIIASAKVIPPVGDLITMAVRDVFDPAAVAAGKLLDEFPADFAAWAERQGLTAFWAQKYWGAHWRLPSTEQGFEMLQRRVIDGEELNLLMKAQDIAPGWRAKLLAISYLPLTRVDVRRMHQIGELTDEDLVPAYQDIGYNEVNAARLAGFTIRLNQGGPVDDEQDLGKLSRTAILGFYRDGIIPRPRAHALLVSIGHTSDAANLYLDSEDFDREREERTSEANLLIESAQAGTITFEQAADRLREIGLSTLEVERALTRLLRAQQQRVKLPTRQEATALWRDRLITDSDFKDVLGRIGYGARWIQAFFDQAKRGGARGT